MIGKLRLKPAIVSFFFKIFELITQEFYKIVLKRDSYIFLCLLLKKSQKNILPKSSTFHFRNPRFVLQKIMVKNAVCKTLLFLQKYSLKNSRLCHFWSFKPYSLTKKFLWLCWTINKNLHNPSFKVLFILQKKVHNLPFRAVFVSQKIFLKIHVLRLCWPLKNIY